MLISIEYAQRAVIRADQRHGALQHCRSHFSEIRSRVKCVGNLEQRLRRFGFAFLVAVDSCVLISNPQLRRDGNQKCDLFIRPMPRCPRVVQSDQTNHFVVEHDRHDQQRTCAETLREETHLMIQLRR